MLTLGQQFARANYRPAGFDYERITLALAVIAWHTIVVCYGPIVEKQIWVSPWRPMAYFIVPSFFALSGFLVGGSLERNDLPSFITLRAMRIFPALAAEVVISALVIGPLVTSLPLRTYFTSRGFFTYFLNIIGDIHYVLPGVFLSNPSGGWVNLQLWTVPLELESYLAISLLSLLALHKRPRLLLVILTAICLAYMAWQSVTGRYPPFDVRPPGSIAVLAFLFGVSLNGLRNQIVFSWTLFVASVLIAWVSVSFQATAYLGPLPIAYATVFLGLQNPERNVIVAGADYSYGMYLYGFPIQQLIVYFAPWSRVWYINLIASVLVSGLCAAFSWHVIESKVLARRKNAVAWVRRLVLRFPILHRLLVEPSAS